MQSANSTMYQLLGLPYNVPCTIGIIMVYLQIHILWSPAYNILLSFLFDVFTHSVVNTLSSIKTTITIINLNTDMQQTIPTFPQWQTTKKKFPKHLLQNQTTPLLSLPKTLMTTIATQQSLSAMIIQLI
ncbi:hypothetical protein J132_09067 [Termitomyces sp. J132]|nr:hypothetical protein J132_09067 [Termitomyces sp. J132]